METKDVLVEAVKAVEEAGVPTDLRSIAFEKAIELVARRGGLQSTPHQQSHPTGSTGGSVAGSSAGESKLGTIARKLGMPQSVVEEVYAEDDNGGLEVIVGVGRLEASTAGATKQLALLSAGGRQLAGIEDWTSAAEIRDVCVQFGKFDTNNFARMVKQMDDLFSFRGRGQQWQVRMNRVGAERLKEMIGALTEAGA